MFAINRQRGLPIGNLTSQWWANCYLNSFDQFVKRELACHGYLRYVDDSLLFSNSRHELMDWREQIVGRMARFRLTIHEESAYPKPVTEGIPFLGFIIFPSHRRLKPRKGYAFCRRLWHLQKSGARERIRASVQGWLNHVRYADTLLYLRMCDRWQWINKGQYHHASAMVSEIGRLLGGWLKTTS